jgi:hypothetical protein
MHPAKFKQENVVRRDSPESEGESEGLTDAELRREAELRELASNWAGDPHELGEIRGAIDFAGGEEGNTDLVFELATRLLGRPNLPDLTRAECELELACFDYLGMDQIKQHLANARSALGRVVPTPKNAVTIENLERMFDDLWNERVLGARPRTQLASPPESERRLSPDANSWERQPEEVGQTQIQFVVSISSPLAG